MNLMYSGGILLRPLLLLDCLFCRQEVMSAWELVNKIRRQGWSEEIKTVENEECFSEQQQSGMNQEESFNVLQSNHDDLATQIY